MANLSEPGKELAEKMLSELGYEERLVGYKMTAATGNARESLYSFQEAVDFLHVGSAETLLTRGGNLSVGYLDPEDLYRWVDGVFQDRELAEAIRTEIDREDSYATKMGSVKGLMLQRLAQCKKVVEPQTEQA